jgi:hypothetical protein
MMQLFKTIAVAGAILAGALGLSQGSASAAPFSAGAMPVVAVHGGLVSQVYHRGRPHYVERQFYRPPRPIYRGYHRGPRIVCRTQIRIVRTAYGRLIRRPVEICTRRF